MPEEAAAVRTRFAPSPTGFMHVGNLRTALYAWLLARSRGGRFILRIEDTDQARQVDGAVDVIYATLAAAGLDHDEGPDVGGPCGPYIQSQRRDLYGEYARQLADQGDAYYCFCGRSETESEDGGEAKPDNTPCPCRELDREEARRRAESGEPFVIRQKLPRSGVTSFSDSVFGEIAIENKVLDDQILLKSDGLPTYNFANVVDDHLMGITHVVRGCEYLSSTPKYNLLYRAFGWEIPVYVHLPLIMGRSEDGTVAKLSKRHGSVSFENLMQEGYLPRAIINYIALLGWSPKNDRELFSLDELCEVFSTSGLNKAPAIFDYGKLAWMNGEYLKALEPADFAARARGFAVNLPEGSELESRWPAIAALLQSRVQKLDEIPEKIAFLVRCPAFPAELYCHKKSKCDPEKAAVILREILPEFEALASWNAGSIFGVIEHYAASREQKTALPAWAVRIAVSGQAVTPGGPGEIMEILGREESLRRMGNALKNLE